MTLQFQRWARAARGDAMIGLRRIEELQAEATYHSERYELYKAKMYGPRPSSGIRLRELERRSLGADTRLLITRCTKTAPAMLPRSRRSRRGTAARRAAGQLVPPHVFLFGHAPLDLLEAEVGLAVFDHCLQSLIWIVAAHTRRATTTRPGLLRRTASIRARPAECGGGGASSGTGAPQPYTVTCACQPCGHSSPITASADHWSLTGPRRRGCRRR